MFKFIIATCLLFPFVGRAQSEKGTFLKSASLWPFGLVRYQVDPSFSQDYLQEIGKAIDHIQRHTGIRFQIRKDQRDYIYFKKHEKYCNSKIGRKGGRQLINLVPLGCTSGAIVHEILHALGFVHEQQREDATCKINWSNIKPEMRHNFVAYSSHQINRVTPYDTQSIMHYRSYCSEEFVYDMKVPCITDDQGNILSQNNILSKGDIRSIETIYREEMRAFRHSIINYGQFLGEVSEFKNRPSMVSQANSHHGIKGLIFSRGDELFQWGEVAPDQMWKTVFVKRGFKVFGPLRMSQEQIDFLVYGLLPSQKFLQQKKRFFEVETLGPNKVDLRFERFGKIYPVQTSLSSSKQMFYLQNRSKDSSKEVLQGPFFVDRSLFLVTVGESIEAPKPPVIQPPVTPKPPVASTRVSIYRGKLELGKIYQLRESLTSASGLAFDAAVGEYIRIERDPGSWYVEIKVSHNLNYWRGNYSIGKKTLKNAL